MRKWIVIRKRRESWLSRAVLHCWVNHRHSEWKGETLKASHYFYMGCTVVLLRLAIFAMMAAWHDVLHHLSISIFSPFPTKWIRIRIERKREPLASAGLACSDVQWVCQCSSISTSFHLSLYCWLLTAYTTETRKIGKPGKTWSTPLFIPFPRQFSKSSSPSSDDDVGS